MEVSPKLKYYSLSEARLSMSEPLHAYQIEPLLVDIFKRSD